MANIVTVSGMFGNGKTYFADAPVIINISGLQWPASSPFNIVRVYVNYGGKRVGDFYQDTGRQSSIEFNIQSALRAIWSDYDYTDEVGKAQAATTATSVAAKEQSRAMRSYTLEIFTEYLSSDDGGVFTSTQCTDDNGNKLIPGGKCLLGGMTEMERSLIANKEDADVSHLEHTNLRNGDASTKPTSSPELVGEDSITSWVDVQEGATRSLFYPSKANTAEDGQSAHAPIVLRDYRPYVDFLFVNRRGAVETCSGMMKEDMNITVETQQYARAGRPTFKPERSLMAIASGGRRSWGMSSGYQTREWAEWWTLEFLMAKQWWMLYKGRYVPVIVEASKKSIDIYDKTKQQMPHVDFTVTLALEG